MTRSARVVNLVGLAAVILYAVMGVLTILVWNPLAAMPGMELREIYRQVEDANESMGLEIVWSFGVMGIVFGFAASVTFLRRRKDPPAVVLAVYLTLLCLGGPAYFWASLPLGMGLADTFYIGGGDRTGVGFLLLGVSAAAFLALMPILARLVFRPPTAY